MKPGSCLVNTARGESLIRMLIAALAQGRLSGAVLDAIANEERYFQLGGIKILLSTAESTAKCF